MKHKITSRSSFNRRIIKRYVALLMYTTRYLSYIVQYNITWHACGVVNEESFPSNLRTPSDSASCMWLKARRHYPSLRQNHLITHFTIPIRISLKHAWACCRWATFVTTYSYVWCELLPIHAIVMWCETLDMMKVFFPRMIDYDSISASCSKPGHRGSSDPCIPHTHIHIF